MYTNEIIDDLNEHGILSIAYLARKHKFDFEQALLILKEIVEDYENVEFKTGYQIYIEERELDLWKPKVKKRYPSPKKIPKYRRMKRIKRIE